MKDDFTPFNGNFIGSDGSIRNLDELIDSAEVQSSGSGGGVSMTQVQNAISSALIPVSDVLSSRIAALEEASQLLQLHRVGMAVVADVDSVRPEGFGQVIWIGKLRPVNMQENDLFIDLTKVV